MRLAKELSSRRNIRLGKRFAFRRDFHVAFVRCGKPSRVAASMIGSRSSTLQEQVFGHVIDVFFAPAVDQQFKQTGNAARPRVRQHRIRCFPAAAAEGGASLSSGWVITL